MNVETDVVEEWDNWDDVAEVKKPLCDIIIFPKQDKGERLQRVYNTMTKYSNEYDRLVYVYSKLFLLIADAIKNGNEQKEICVEVAEFIAENELHLFENHQLSKQRIYCIVNGVYECMRYARNKRKTLQFDFPDYYDGRILESAKYESNYYPCHKRHFLAGVNLYKIFMAGYVKNMFKHDREFYQYLLDNYAEI